MHCAAIDQAKGETLGAKKHASKMDHIVKTSLKFTLWFFHLLQQPGISQRSVSSTVNNKYGLIIDTSPILISDFDPKEYILRPKLAFLTFMLIMILSPTQKLAECIYLYLYCAWKNEKKHPQNSKTAKIFSTAKNGSVCLGNLKLMIAF